MPKHGTRVVTRYQVALYDSGSMGSADIVVDAGREFIVVEPYDKPDGYSSDHGDEWICLVEPDQFYDENGDEDGSASYTLDDVLMTDDHSVLKVI